MYKQREKIIVLFSLLLLLGGVIPGQAQKDNRFEVSKNLDIFNALVKEVEMFYVDSVDVEKTVRRGIDAMLGGLDPYTEYYPEQEMDKLKFMTTGEYGGFLSYGLCIFNTIFVLGTPFNRALTSSEDLSVTSTVSIARMRSPAFNPAKAAGIPSNGSII